MYVIDTKPKQLDISSNSTNRMFFLAVLLQSNVISSLATQFYAKCIH